MPMTAVQHRRRRGPPLLGVTFDRRKTLVTATDAAGHDQSGRSRCHGEIAARCLHRCKRRPAMLALATFKPLDRSANSIFGLPARHVEHILQRRRGGQESRRLHRGHGFPLAVGKLLSALRRFGVEAADHNQPASAMTRSAMSRPCCHSLCLATWSRRASWRSERKYLLSADGLSATRKAVACWRTIHKKTPGE